MVKKKSVPTKTERTRTEANSTVGSSEQDFLIVGIGASAGGLEACTRLLRSLPADTGLSFVVVQHLEPDHENMLVPLLSRETALKVSEAPHSVALQPNHVYVIPKTLSMTLSRGRLKLANRTRRTIPQTPIDTFFSSLASDLGRRSVGVILSGAGADGAAGLRAIAAEGGITFAQDEVSDRQSGVPHRAIVTGAVDFILPPEIIAKELMSIAKHPYLRTGNEEESSQLGDGFFPRIVMALHAATGVDFSGYRQSTIVRRIRRRMALHRIERPESYLEHLHRTATEARALYEDILIHFTKFFRDEDAFEVLRTQIMPSLMAGKASDQSIRVWVPGCATGEEVYSIAIVMMESMAIKGTRPFQIFGTDLSERAIEKARSGVFTEADVVEIAPELLNRYFFKTSHGYQIRKEVRDKCIFARHDLVKDPPFSRLDFISCRNVLIYMAPALQKRVVETFHYALMPKGLLMLGNAESVGTQSHLFMAADSEHRIYSRKPSPARSIPMPDVLKATPVHALPEVAPAFDLSKEVERVLAVRYWPAAVVVDAELQILQFYGDTGPYLKPSQGMAALHLLKMLREELAVDVRTLLDRVKKRHGQASRTGARVTIGDRIHDVTVDVIPIKGRRQQDDYLVVFLDPKPIAETVPATSLVAGSKGGKNPDAERLRQELSMTREFLHSAVQQVEVTNEEARAATEEILSNNEELQSANEELATAKEQLQSSNEELITLNEELQTRNAELAQANNDLGNLLLNLKIPVVIVGPDQRIRHIAPAAENLFNLMITDVGRPISDIQHNFDGLDVSSLISSVMRSGTPQEHEVMDNAGKWHSVRVYPYRAGNRVEGTLITAMDVDVIQRSLEEVRLARDYAGTIVDTTHEPLLVLDEELRVFSVNKAFSNTFHIAPDKALGSFLFDLDGGEWNIPHLRGILSDVLRTGQGVENLELSHAFPNSGLKRMLLNVRLVLRKSGLAHLILLGIADVTASTKAMEELYESESLLRALFEAAAQAVIGVNKGGEIVFANPAAERIFGFSLAELIGRGIEDLMPERFRGNHTRFRAGYFSHPPRQMGPNLNIFGLRKDGAEIPIEVSIASVPTRRGMLSVAFVDDVSARKAAEQTLKDSQSALAESHEHLRRLTSGLFRSQEEERRRISRDLHDDLNQRLASLVMEVEMVEQILPASSTKTRKKLGSIRQHAEQISDGVRRAAYQIHPSILEHLGLVAALKSLCADFKTHYGLEVALSYDNIPPAIPMESALCLYRIAQESLRNVVKHSGMNSARLAVSGAEGKIRLSVEDSGAGISQLPQGERSGLGIVSMEERARLAGGTLGIRSGAVAGTIVEVSLPLNRNV